MPLSFARSTLVAASLALAPVVLTMVLPVPASAQAFSALRQSIAEAAAADEALVAFYRDRDFEPVWTVSEAADRRNALLRALEQAGAHGLPVARYETEALRAAFRDATNPWLRGQADVMASRIFLQYAQDVHGGFLDPSTIIPDIFQDQPHRDPYALMTEFLDSNPHQYMAQLPPQTPGYTRLMRTKFELEDLAANGGYGPTVQAGSLRPGDAGPAVVQLRNRLMRMGYLDRSATAEYDSTLQAAVVAFQTNHGITADGIAGEATIRAVNRSIEDHWNEIVLSMERHRWLNDGQVHDRLIFVNLTDFHTRVIDDGEVTFITRSVIGARDRQTPEFSDEMEHMVINPSWYVPRSIAQRSYIPGILAGRGTYMQLLAGGRPVNPASIDMSRYTVNNFPFDLRQPPGPRNALGTVKFMFPNRHAIYLHDTPEQHLMNSDVRAYSSGCIRLADPHEFAYHLLERQTDDPVGLFQGIRATGEETYVHLDVHIPVHLTYLTAWVESDGHIQFRNDIYGRNARLSQAVQALGVVMPEASS
ncbi:L,D-transpeptidase family protein [Roseicyclus mahoneyensis]|uniref:Murein L,D-transpeptidase YcbB/YkuD n=1 Tax=Roseicyclus mahoneyensis TaxID=164332 RepID=A0A316GSI0_9RHOB|nr:L,D-transpeptidase family protein [Roseicyclus mahoneyensis]PWK62566.1 murein L,D-transpeptidase YcbB/YkuD [Roseicyclus mahoneyensis]